MVMKFKVLIGVELSNDIHTFVSGYDKWWLVCINGLGLGFKYYISFIVLLH